MQAEASVYSPPKVNIGDCVYWHHNPLNCENPVMGWVCERPGTSTISILVFSPMIGFQDKPSVRHRTDPGLQENPEWRQWGCWEYAPQTEQLKKIEGLMPQIVSVMEQLSLARKQNGGKPAENR